MFSLFEIFARKNQPVPIARSKLDDVCNQFPHPLLPFQMLDNDWAHFLVKQDGDSLELDGNRLNDGFIRFLDKRIGGFEGKNVLELGPYEAFHTHSLCNFGAAKVLSIEGNPRNFLKCLIVKNHYQLNAAQFLLGNFLKYLNQSEERFDFILCAGVLYHSAKPIELLNEITKKTDAFGICTAVYEAEHVAFKLTGETREVVLEGTDPFLLHERYNVLRKTRNQKHGMERSAWLISQDDLLRYLEFRGFEYVIFKQGYFGKSGGQRLRLFAKRKV